MTKSFHFDFFKDFFDFYMRESIQRRPGKQKLSLEQLAKKLGYNSPSTLSMVARGQRLPSAALLNALFEEWKITPVERERIRLRVEIERKTRKGIESSQFVSQLNKMTPYHKIDLKSYNLVKDWYILVIKVLAECPNFSADPEDISKKLRKKLTATQAKQALALLIESGHLIEDPITNKLSPRDFSPTETSHDISSEAIRNNHRGTLELALQALDEQKVEQRHFNGLTLQFSSSELPRAKERILNFVKEFNEEFQKSQSDQIYQLCVQLFELTNAGDKNDA